MRTFRRLSSVLWLGITLVILIIAAIQRERVIDWLVLQNYAPSSEIITLADATTMNDQAKRLFYVNKPAIEDREAFNKSCTNKTEQTLVLGCYHGNRQGIYIFKVDSAELQGVQEVTAAHEMLHQAYDRLSASERKYIDRLLQDFYDHGLQDQAVKDQVAGYQKSEPDAVINEMHSLFGTEVKDLPDELERYYTRYFTRRSAVVSLYDHYQAAFTERQKQVESYDQQLADQKKSIEALQVSLQAQLGQLDVQKTQMDAYRQSQNTTAYNQMVAPYNALIDTYNGRIQILKQKISAYNALVEKRNAIAEQEQQLQQELSSKQLQSVTGE